MDDIGFAAQTQVYAELGGVVIDSADIREDPERALGKLCDAIGIPFDPAMLSWPAGPREEDGIWAKHWYGTVHQSTGFAGAEGPLPEIGPAQRDLLDQALPYYQAMASRKL